MDFTKYIDIVLIEDPESTLSQIDYINGVVLTSNIADKRMENRFKDPKILLLKGNLSYQ